MLHILLLILKIIGIILAILASILILVMLIPFSYVGKGDFKDESRASLVAKWIFYIIYFKFSYRDKEMTYVLRILGIPVIRGVIGEDAEELAGADIEGAAQNFEENIEGKSKSKRRNTPDDYFDNMILGVENDESIKKEIKDDNDKAAYKRDGQENIKEDEDKPDIKSGIKKIISGFKNAKVKFKSFRRNIKNLKRFLKSKKTKVAYFYAKDIIKKIYYHIKPSRFETNLIFGFDSPDMTGKALAVLGVLYGTVKINPEKISIIPDFENRRLEGNIFFKGHFVMGYILIHILKLYFKKEVHDIIEMFNGEQEV